ncbi:hypothetical protein ACFQAT_26170 [Undibacterium arcticum]|uniref:hypothetical protein n=1 Tax=Undibacterium arcticum TaxID=1762892 RepID=UPI0036205760
MQTSPSNSNVAQLPTPDSAAKQPMVSESISKTQAFALQQSAAAMRPAAQPTAQLFVTKEVEIGTTESSLSIWNVNKSHRSFRSRPNLRATSKQRKATGLTVC